MLSRAFRNIYILSLYFVGRRWGHGDSFQTQQILCYQCLFLVMVLIKQKAWKLPSCYLIKLSGDNSSMYLLVFISGHSGWWSTGVWVFSNGSTCFHMCVYIYTPTHLLCVHVWLCNCLMCFFLPEILPEVWLNELSTRRVDKGTEGIQIQYSDKLIA